MKAQNFSEPFSASALGAAARFVRRNFVRAFSVSTLVVVPCFWHRHIEAGDLASHVYNAWLAQLIARGEAPGLWIARQSSNILFDVTLSFFARLFGFGAAEKIAVSLAVLVFFWGAFALACAAARRPAWFLTPLLAMAAYGWTFEMGFMNYYIALGLAFWGIALLWRGRHSEWAVITALVPLIWLAHPLGLLLLAGAGGWVILANAANAKWRVGAWIAAIVSLVLVHLYITRHYQVFSSIESLYSFNGSDQFLLYGPQYRLPLILLMGLVALCLLSQIVSDGQRIKTESHSLPAELYSLVLITILLLPEGMFLPQYAAPASFLHERLSLIAAVFACCALATLQPRRWHFAGFAAVAAIFFVLLYRDTATINHMEDEAAALVSTLPTGQRVLSTIQPSPGSRIFIFHLVDRACAGRCFSYGNYEPASEQFRIRANPDNRIVTTSMDDSIAIERGQYVVKPEDLPLYQISRCSQNSAELCVHQLVAGEMNGQSGFRPSSRVP